MAHGSSLTRTAGPTNSPQERACLHRLLASICDSTREVRDPQITHRLVLLGTDAVPNAHFGLLEVGERHLGRRYVVDAQGELTLDSLQLCPTGARRAKTLLAPCDASRQQPAKLCSSLDPPTATLKPCPVRTRCCRAPCPKPLFPVSPGQSVQRHQC
jgi:hypothetical protein